MDDLLYDEFGNYIGPELASDGESEDEAPSFARRVSLIPCLAFVFRSTCAHVVCFFPLIFFFS